MTSLVGIQGYVFYQVYAEQQKKDPNDYLDQILATVKSCGLSAYEQGMASREIATRLASAIKDAGIKMPSMYAGGKLHTSDWKQNVQTILQKAAWGKEMVGATIVVVNPDPIQWGKPFDKNDQELQTQAQALQALGESLSAQGQVLAYHTHDPEMRNAAREFHHMMQATDANVVRFCLDTHWVYRGAGNSQVAMYDIAKMYLKRISSLHIRQSQAGIWTEILCDGDIDYNPLVKMLESVGHAGPIVIEQCREQGTPNTMPLNESIKQSREWVKEVFGC